MLLIAQIAVVVVLVAAQQVLEPGGAVVGLARGEGRGVGGRVQPHEQLLLVPLQVLLVQRRPLAHEPVPALQRAAQLVLALRHRRRRHVVGRDERVGRVAEVLDGETVVAVQRAAQRHVGRCGEVEGGAGHHAGHAGLDGGERVGGRGRVALRQAHGWRLRFRRAFALRLGFRVDGSGVG